MAQSTNLPTSQNALVLTSTSLPPSVQTVPIPPAVAGSAVVQILAANVLPYARDIYNGTRSYPFPTPLVIGSSALGCIAATGPDATALKPGQLVFVDITVRGRDNPAEVMLLGLHEGGSEGSRALMRGEWRNATYAEYARVPLENCYAVDEARTLGAAAAGGLGYQVEDLAFIPRLAVPFGGLRAMDVRAGETVVVAPATGSFGGAAVHVAAALGARVVAAGRNIDALEALAAGMGGRVETVRLEGDVVADADALMRYGPVDAYLDMSPAAAAKSTHIKSCLLALRPGGHGCFMGGIAEDVAIPYGLVMFKSLQLRGRFMYEREDVQALIKMIELGVLKMGEDAGLKCVGKFGLGDWDKAFSAAAENPGHGLQALIVP